jgi:hypothetical protein
MQNVEVFLSLTEPRRDSRFSGGFAQPTCVFTEPNYHKLFATSGEIDNGTVTHAGNVIAQIEVAKVTDLSNWTAAPSELEASVLVKNPNNDFLRVARGANRDGLGLGIRNGLAVYENILYVLSKTTSGWRTTRPITQQHQASLHAEYANWRNQL